jgi:hypothetical protein
MASESYFCALCHLDSDETLVHLTLGLAPFVQDDLLQTISAFKDFINKPMEIIISMCWSIWFALNDLIFRNLQHSVGSTKVIFKKEMALVKLGAKNKYQPMLDLWLDNFV